MPGVAPNPKQTSFVRSLSLPHRQCGWCNLGPPGEAGRPLGASSRVAGSAKCPCAADGRARKLCTCCGIVRMQDESDPRLPHSLPYLRVIAGKGTVVCYFVELGRPARSRLQLRPTSSRHGLYPAVLCSRQSRHTLRGIPGGFAGECNIFGARSQPQ